MAEEKDPPPDTKLTRTKERWGARGRFLTGKTSRPRAQRLPPGQHLTRDWPTLDLGQTPRNLEGALAARRLWLGRETDFLGLGPVHRANRRRNSPPTSIAFTTLSRYDNQWEGLATRDLLERAGRATKRASSCCALTTATPPISHWKTLPPRMHCSRIVGRANRSRQITAARCGWCCRISISGKARSGCKASNSSPRTDPAYWEARGYHNRGNPWKEERYSQRLISAAGVHHHLSHRERSDFELARNPGEGLRSIERA